SDAADEDDVPPGTHEMRPGGPNEASVRRELEREAVFPILICERQEIAALRRSSVANDEIDPAEPGRRVVCQSARRVRIPEVGRMDERAASRRLYAGGGRLEPGARARRNHHIAAFAREFDGDRSADSPARSGNDRGLPVEPQLHLSALPAFL